MGELSHFDAAGASRMVDVGDKPVTRRLARASATVRMAAETLALVQSRHSKKGDVLEVARLAGIMAAKRTADLIPLCHPLAIDVGHRGLHIPGRAKRWSSAARWPSKPRPASKWRPSRWFPSRP